jgi:glycosyltransferase involved in cell wall biosynthesis
MKIAFINNFYNPGGSTKTAFALAQKFSKDNEMQFYGFWDGIYREKFQEIGKTFLLESKNFDYKNEILESISHFSPDIIHIFMPGSQNPTYFYNLPAKSKKFITVLCNQKIGFDPSIFDKIFFLSKFGQSISGKFENSLIIRPSFNYDFKESEQNKIPILSRISAFCSSKLIDHTFKAAETFKNNSFNVGGEIQDLSYYQYLLSFKKNQHLDNVKIYHNMDDLAVKKIIEECDVWHYPTSSEVFCFSALEAMAAKKPVISYKLDAVKELFDSEDWLADDFGDMIAKTENLINKPKSERQKIGLKNYEMYLKNSVDIFANSIMNEYKKSLANSA